jgi:hypothetical protein
MSGLPIPDVPSSAPKPGTMWLHFKGQRYCVVCVAIHSESHDLIVVYTDGTKTWCRPLSMWAEEARPGVPRFTLLK